MQHSLTMSQIMSLFDKNRRSIDRQLEEISRAILQIQYSEEIITPEGWHPARFRAAIKQFQKERRL